MVLYNDVTIHYVIGVCRVAQWKVAKSIKKARCAGMAMYTIYMIYTYM